MDSLVRVWEEKGIILIFSLLRIIVKLEEYDTY